MAVTVGISIHSGTGWYKAKWDKMFRFAVRVLYRPPKQYNPNWFPIGDGFGFIVFLRILRQKHEHLGRGINPAFFAALVLECALSKERYSSFEGVLSKTK